MVSRREELLAELSQRLGIAVSDVRRRTDAVWVLRVPHAPESCFCRMTLPSDVRRQLPLDWQPDFPHEGWEMFGKSGEFRKPVTLQRMAQRHGRPARSRPFVIEDGRRIVRLMFDIYLPRED